MPLPIIGFENAEILMPLVLVFLIFFFALNTTKILGGKKFIDALIALAIALLTIRNEYVIDKINFFIPSIFLMILIALFIMLAIGIFRPGLGKFGLGIIFFIVAIVVFLAAINNKFADNFAFLFTEYSVHIIIFALVTGLIIYFLTRKKKEK